jgi:hypothetical protein
VRGAELMRLQQKMSLYKPLVRQFLRTLSGGLVVYMQDVDDHIDRCLEVRRRCCCRLLVPFCSRWNQHRPL